MKNDCKTVRVALLGIGNMGQNHLRVLSILKDVEVKCIFDVDEAALRAAAQKYNIPHSTDLDEATRDVDAVIIATPTSTHFEYFQACVQKAKFIFVEKPIAESSHDARLMKELCLKHGVQMQVGFIERFNSAVIELKNIAGESTVINADFTRTNRLSSRISDVDVILDLMIHDVDLALYLNGPVQRVSAYGMKENGLAAFASAVLCHKNGSYSRVLASRVTEKKIRQIQLTTDSAFVDCDLLRKEITINRQTSLSQEPDRPYRISSLGQQVQVGPQEALLLELQAFICLCQGASSDVPDVDAGLNALIISEMISEQIEC